MEVIRSMRCQVTRLTGYGQVILSAHRQVTGSMLSQVTTLASVVRSIDVPTLARTAPPTSSRSSAKSASQRDHIAEYSSGPRSRHKERASLCRLRISSRCRARRFRFPIGQLCSGARCLRHSTASISSKSNGEQVGKDQRWKVRKRGLIEGARRLARRSPKYALLTTGTCMT